MPGKAIGSTSRNDTASRPKKLKRWTPNAAAEPSTSAIAVASAPACSESHRAWAMSPSWYAAENQLVVQPGIGQLWMFDRLNAYRQMTAIGT